jgi:hypothetical protein
LSVLQCRAPLQQNGSISILWRKAKTGREIDPLHMPVLTLDIIGDVAFTSIFKRFESSEKWAQDDSIDELTLS